jgi:hypothetical protein
LFEELRVAEFLDARLCLFRSGPLIFRTSSDIEKWHRELGLTFEMKVLIYALTTG